MNKDLEIIKNEIKNFGEQSIQTSLDIIITTAERMAAEIEAQSKIGYAAQELLKDKNNEIARLKDELEKEFVRANFAENKLMAAEKENERLKEELEHYKHISQIKTNDEWFASYILRNVCRAIEYKNKIEHLTSELEKKPEVVYCEGCIYKNQCKAAVIFQESTPKMEGPFKFYYLKFCSYGQRKSKEK